MKNEEKLYLEIIKSILNNEYKLPPFDIKYKRAVFDIAKNHSMLQLIFEKSMEVGLLAKTDSYYDFWKEKYVLYKTRDLRQLIAKDEIFDILSQNNIRVMPLKGILIKELYPETYYRRMTDLDILINSEDAESVKELLSSIGYKFCEKGTKHFSMVKGASIAVEIHTMLFENELEKPFENIWDNASEISPNIFVMSNVDLFLHTILHYGEHFLMDGMGIRAITDVYMLKKAFPEVLTNKDFIDRLEKSGFSEFFVNLIQISEKWFGFGENTCDEALEEYLLLSGTFGRMNDKTTVYAMRITDSNKKSVMLLNSFFPNLEYMKKRFNCLYKYPFLLPFFWIVRLARLLLNLKNNKLMLKDFSNVSLEDIEQRKIIIEKFGLSNKKLDKR